jgi:cytochrome c biogenesis protein CcdA
LTKPEVDGELRIPAAAALARGNYTAGFTALTRDYASLDTAHRAGIAEALYEPSVPSALPFLKLLLTDQVDEVRKGAASAALSVDDNPRFTMLVLDELIRPEALLKPHEVYGYRFESQLRNSVGTRVSKWAEAVLDDSEAPTGRMVLATIIFRKQANATAAKKLEVLAGASESHWVRRAAWYALGKSRPREISRLAEKIAGDTSPFVREVLPALLLRSKDLWVYHFDDLHEDGDHSWSSDEISYPRISDADEAILRKLAASDPAPQVRFTSLLALLSQGRSINLEELVAIIPVVPKEFHAKYRIKNWVTENIQKLTPDFQPLLTAIGTDDFSTSDLEKIKKRIATGTGSQARAIMTFSELAASLSGKSEQVAVPVDDDDADKVASDASGEKAAPTRTSLPLVFFYKPGCQECARVREMLDTVRRDFPLLQVEEYNLLDPKGTLLNQAICSRLEVPAIRHTLAPSVFTQEGWLALDEITPKSLSELLEKTRKAAQDDHWKVLDDVARDEAEKTVEHRYEGITLGVVLLAGLIDGINPCAFATIIFFLSYLQVARRTSREMLMTGAAFIAGVFIAYFAAGVVLYQILDQLHKFAWLQRGMNIVFGGLALLAAGLSLLDAWRAKQGRLEDMTLQLPAFIKDRIRTSIRTGARATKFVVAAFVTGIVISFLELACTGQVYAPIVYQIQQGRVDAIGMLTLYNLAFIAPLVALFLATWFGMKSEVLINFQRKHTFAVKIALAALFLLLAVMIFR